MIAFMYVENVCFQFEGEIFGSLLIGGRCQLGIEQEF